MRPEDRRAAPPPGRALPARRLATAVPGLILRELTAADVRAYFAVIDRNRDHLGRYGDFQPEKHATLAWVTTDLAEPAHDRFGIWLGDDLIGRVDLVPVNPPHYAVGYWLSREHTGHGYATAACAALIEHGRDRYGATDVYAGVTHGNDRSVAVLRRLGFRLVDRLDTYDRYHLPLTPGPPRPSARRADWAGPPDA